MEVAIKTITTSTASNAAAAAAAAADLRHEAAILARVSFEERKKLVLVYTLEKSSIARHWPSFVMVSFMLRAVSGLSSRHHHQHHIIKFTMIIVIIRCATTNSW
jgi:hypothetical protein